MTSDLSPVTVTDAFIAHAACIISRDVPWTLPCALLFWSVVGTAEQARCVPFTACERITALQRCSQGLDGCSLKAPTEFMSALWKVSLRLSVRVQVSGALHQAETLSRNPFKQARPPHLHAADAGNSVTVAYRLDLDETAVPPKWSALHQPTPSDKPSACRMPDSFSALYFLPGLDLLVSAGVLWTSPFALPFLSSLLCSPTQALKRQTSEGRTI